MQLNKSKYDKLTNASYCPASAEYPTSLGGRKAGLPINRRVI